jgi:anti-sigma factor RsiW
MSDYFERVRFLRDCRWAKGHMSDYLDGELAASRRRRMERHVRECRRCRRALAMLRRMVSALRRLPPPTGGADARQIAASVRRRLGEGEPPPP